MPGVDFALLRARVALFDVLGLIGFIPCETSGALGARTVSGPPFRFAIEPQLLRQLKLTYL